MAIMIVFLATEGGDIVWRVFTKISMPLFQEPRPGPAFLGRRPPLARRRVFFPTLRTNKHRGGKRHDYSFHSRTGTATTKLSLAEAPMSPSMKSWRAAVTAIEQRTVPQALPGRRKNSTTFACPKASHQSKSDGRPSFGVR